MDGERTFISAAGSPPTSLYPIPKPSTQGRYSGCEAIVTLLEPIQSKFWSVQHARVEINEKGAPVPVLHELPREGDVRLHVPARPDREANKVKSSDLLRADRTEDLGHLRRGESGRHRDVLLHRVTEDDGAVEGALEGRSDRRDDVGA